MRTKWLMVLFCFSLTLSAQSDDELEEWAMKGNEEAIEEWTFKLLGAAELFDLNTVEKSTLEQIPFLNKELVQAIIHHRETYGKFYSIYELQVIDGMNADLFKQLSKILIVKGLTDDVKVQEGRYIQFFRLRGDKRAGAILRKTNPDHPHAFLGSNLYQLHRIQHQQGKWQFSLTAEQDPGEAMRLSNSQLLFDFISTSISYESKVKGYKWIFGDFRASFGQGLILGGRPQVKSQFPMNIVPGISRINLYRGTAELGFFRGLAFAKHQKSWGLMAIASALPADAAITDEGELGTKANTGWHRTQTEFSRRKTYKQLTTAARFYKTHSKWELGFQAMYTADAVQGSITNPMAKASVDFKRKWKQTFIWGELATDNLSKSAGHLGVLFSPDQAIDLVFHARHYEPNFYDAYSQVLSEFSGAANESGFYSGLQWRLYRKWEARTYIDYYKRKAASFNALHGFSGFDAVLALERKTKSNSFLIRLKQEEKPNNHAFTTTKGLVQVSMIQQRLQYRFLLNDDLEMTIRYDRNSAKVSSTQQSAHLIFAELRWHKKHSPWQLRAKIYQFNCPDYNLRFYTLEQEGFQRMRAVAWDGQGSALWLLVGRSVNRKIDLRVRTSLTMLSQAQEKGSGTDARLEHFIPECSVQLIVKW